MAGLWIFARAAASPEVCRVPVDALATTGVEGVPRPIVAVFAAGIVLGAALLAFAVRVSRRASGAGAVLAVAAAGTVLVGLLGEVAPAAHAQVDYGTGCTLIHIDIVAVGTPPVLPGDTVGAQHLLPGDTVTVARIAVTNSTVGPITVAAALEADSTSADDAALRDALTATVAFADGTARVSLDAGAAFTAEATVVGGIATTTKLTPLADLIAARDAEGAASVQWATPLRMDLVVSDDGSFDARDWFGEFDPAILDYVTTKRLVTGRAIVATADPACPSGDIVRVARTLGFEVRILATPLHYVMYDDRVAVLRERAADGAPRHRLTGRSVAVETLRHLFALQWSMASPWNSSAGSEPDVLQLLAPGLTDAQIAAATNLSMRTVSRRITEAMRAAEATTRFQLGVRFAQRGSSESS